MEKDSIIKKIKKGISFETKVRLHLAKLKYSGSKKPFFRFNNKKSRVYIFLAADYGNLGDVAITYAQHAFLKQCFPERQVIEIPISKTLQGLTMLKKLVTPNDIITTVGGGNMGDLYHQIEYFRQLVIEAFPNNKIVSFPQTIDFSIAPDGRKKLDTAKKVYGSHQHLTLIAREEKSYRFFKDNFPNNKVLLLPDIVMTLNRTIPKYKREGIIICLREDKEKKLNPAQEKQLIEYTKKRFKLHNYYDTHVGGTQLSMKKRLTALFAIWEAFKKAELVVTDRLHGMIFCHITNTPALVFLNNNHKIIQSYEWIKHNKKITLIKEYDFAAIPKAMDLAINGEESKQISLINNYKDFKDLIK
ncbi:polysaccharide pyruvyl transferase family protein [Galbibacter sp. PAP.153]|uniref:polysaccharide pyruvyl transferase family protein n=1 Tax=Galbibacter sp. PAP.153 TaxID=3104623 RepID=UPI0030097741